MSRIAGAFAAARAEGRTALVAYVPAGFPTKAASLGVLKAIADAGADVIELGIPFSDPIADGPVIREAVHQALRDGTTLSWALELVAEARAAGVTVPILLMGYCNPFLAFGLDKLVARAAGIADGLIVPDLPVDESESWRAALDRHDLDLVGLVAPTTTPGRRKIILERGSGFIYAIAVKGITGERAEMAPEILESLAALRAATTLPVAVGFGISTPAHVEALVGHADGVIVGSALVRAIQADQDHAADAAGRFITGLARAAGRPAS